MASYIMRRLLLMIPTLIGIMTINFFIVQAAPGGPVDRTIAAMRGIDTDPTARFSSSGSELVGGSAAATQAAGGGAGDSLSRSSRGLHPELVEEIKKIYGFDQPILTRYVKMLKSYAQFDLGKSFYSDRRVIDLVWSKLPVSISIGLWTTLLFYTISIPLGIRKAQRNGTAFDRVSSFLIIAGYAVPSFLFAILLIILFAGGSYFSIFPLRGLVSDGWQQMGMMARVLDYFWHLVLPITAMVIGSFASLTMLTKNSFIDEIGKLYVTTARAKGLTESTILYRHVFRNAMLLVIAGLPAALMAIFFTSSLLIEVIFSLDGLGLLGYESAVNRDYPVVFGTLYIFTLLGLILSLVGDILYMVIDPRIDFERRHVNQ